MISLCTIDSEHSGPGTEVTIVWGWGDPRQPPDPGTRSGGDHRAVALAPDKTDRRRSDPNPSGSENTHRRERHSSSGVNSVASMSTAYPNGASTTLPIRTEPSVTSSVG